MARYFFLLVLMSAVGCSDSGGGGRADAGDAAAHDSAMDSQVVGDGGVEIDSATDDGGEEPDAAVEEDAAIMDAGMDANCGNAMDAGTQTVATVCTRICGTYLPVCATVPPSCQSSCQTANAMLTPTQLGRVYVCANVASAGDCAAAQACVTTAVACP